jgi:predicted CopG family antitoxin
MVKRKCLEVKIMNKLKHITISEQNYENLRRLGNTPDSFNTIINRMLKEKEMLESESRVGTRGTRL